MRPTRTSLFSWRQVCCDMHAHEVFAETRNNNAKMRTRIPNRTGISAPTYPSLMCVHSPCRSEGGPNVSFSSTCHIFMLTGASFSLPAATFILFDLVQAVDHAAVDGPPFAGRGVSATAAGQTMRFKRTSLLCCLLGCRHTRWQLVEGMPAMFPRNRNAHMRTHTHSKSHPHPYH